MLITKVTGPRNPRPVIGRILLEDADGHAHLTVHSDLSPSSRPRVLYCEDGIYVQQRETPDKQWVYRYVGPRGAEQPTSEGLRDYRTNK